MKNFKKVLAIILAMAMFFALSMTAFAATTVSTTQDTSMLSITSSGNTVTYQAVTVDGGTIGGVSYPTTTVYTYCIKTSNSYYASVTFGNPHGYNLYIDNMYTTNSTSFTTYLPKNGHYTVDLKNSNGVLQRTFQVSVVDANSVNVSIEINCHNAKQWLANHNDATVLGYYDALSSDVGGFNDIGKMTTVVTLNLPGGSTAMDAIYAMAAGCGITLSGTGSTTGTGGTVCTYLQFMDGLGHQTCGNQSGWCFVKSTNSGDHYYLPQVSATAYYLTEGEHIIWTYTVAGMDNNGDIADLTAAINATN